MEKQRFAGTCYKAANRVHVGDLFMSLIHTCQLNGANPFDYLPTLQQHKSRLFKKPHKYMPWNYHLITRSQTTTQPL